MQSQAGGGRQKRKAGTSGDLGGSKARKSASATLEPGEITAADVIKMEHSTAVIREQNALIEKLKLRSELRCQVNKEIIMQSLCEKFAPDYEPVKCPEAEELQVMNLLEEIV